MLTISDVRSILSTLLAPDLGAWRFSNGQQLPSIWAGDPPRGTEMIVPGIECIILRAPELFPTPLLASETPVGMRVEVILRQHDTTRSTEAASRKIIKAFDNVTPGGLQQGTNEIFEQQNLLINEDRVDPFGF